MMPSCISAVCYGDCSMPEHEQDACNHLSETGIVFRRPEADQICRTRLSILLNQNARADVRSQALLSVAYIRDLRQVLRRLVAGGFCQRQESHSETGMHFSTDYLKSLGNWHWLVKWLHEVTPKLALTFKVTISSHPGIGIDFSNDCSMSPLSWPQNCKSDFCIFQVFAQMRKMNGPEISIFLFEYELIPFLCFRLTMHSIPENLKILKIKTTMKKW